MSYRLSSTALLLAWAVASTLGTTAPSFAQTSANASAAVVTLNEQKPKVKVTVPAGAEITVKLVSQPRFGYHWDVTWVKSDCGKARNAAGHCFETPHKPIQGDWPNEFVATIKAPDVKSTVEIAYGCFPPHAQNGVATHHAELVYDLVVIVK